MEKRNYSKELERLIKQNKGRKPTVLLHSCCGPCSSAVLEYLTQYFEVAVLWYNPNLYPESEFFKRLDTQRELIDKEGLTESVRLIPTEWRSEEYYAAAQGLENEPEGGARCTKCFRLRLEECARLAEELGFEYFCTTLSVSRYKDAVRVNNIGEALAQSYNVKWLPSDFKKKGGEMRSAQLAKEYGLYQQNYCGCEFSLNNRLEYEKRMQEAEGSIDK